MQKQDVKNILMSMRTQENSEAVNYLLGRIDMMDEQAIQENLAKVGDSIESVTQFFEQKITQKNQTPNHDQQKYTINSMFTYGVSGNCVHLHLPGDLHGMISEKGMSKTIGTVNLNLLDAIDRLKRLKESGHPKLQGKDSVYMISPILIPKEIKFLEEMDFHTHSYKKKDLKDDEFVANTPEAQLAIHIFGKDNNIGTALISFDTIASQEWQEKKQRKIKEFADKGIVLEDKIQSKE